MTDAEILVQRLLSDAGMFEYNAGKTAGESREHWLKRAADKREQAAQVSADYRAPEFVMPEWGTRGN